jgi:CheY-like chemotaxis protein
MKKKLILHIDDEPDILAATVEVLAQEGYTVISANNALTGLRLFGKYEQELVGIIVDLRMVPLDGLQFAQEVRTVSNVPILAFSAYLNAENQRNCVDVGIDGYIKKPATVSSILEAVKRCFDVTEAAPNEE